MVLRGSPAKVVTHHLNLGQGAALQSGITFALERGAAYVVTFDGGGQHRVEDAVSAVRVLAGGWLRCRLRVALPRRCEKVRSMRRILLKSAVAFANVSRRVLT